jgi:hypothetical protein
MTWEYLDKKAERRYKETVYPLDFPCSAEELEEYYGIRLQPGHMVLTRDMSKQDRVHFIGQVSCRLGGCDCCGIRGDIIALNDELVAYCSEHLENENALISRHSAFDDGKEEIRAEHHKFLEEQRAKYEEEEARAKEGKVK